VQKQQKWCSCRDKTHGFKFCIFQLEMMHIQNHAFCVGRSAENEKRGRTFFGQKRKSDAPVETKRMVLNYAF